MRRNNTVGRFGIALALLAVATSLPAAAQRDNVQEDRMALAIGVGIVDTESEGDFYGTVAMRFRVGGDDRDGYRGGMVGYIEPEIGYWTRDENFVDASDLLVGVNLVGVVPSRNVDYFIGAGVGVHSLDSEFLVGGDALVEDDETVFGANLQVGLDLKVSRNLALFGVGRYDLLDSDIFDSQAKVYLGLRFKF